MISRQQARYIRAAAEIGGDKMTEYKIPDKEALNKEVLEGSEM